MAAEGIDFEAEYNNRARVPEHPVAYRGAGSAMRRPIVPKPAANSISPMGPANVIASISSIRDGDAGGPVVLFIHGGYWQALDKSFSSHLARGANERGLTVAVPNYTLAPTATLAEIVSEMEAAADFLVRRMGRPLVATGHSAGGRIAACLMAPPCPADHAPAGPPCRSPACSTCRPSSRPRSTRRSA